MAWQVRVAPRVINMAFDEETKNSMAWEEIRVSQRDELIRGVLQNVRLRMARPRGNSRATRKTWGRGRWHCLGCIIGERFNAGGC